jgi:hypothetical protein
LGVGGVTLEVGEPVGLADAPAGEDDGVGLDGVGDGEGACAGITAEVLQE